MKVGAICKREVAYVHESARVSEAARLMRERHVGSLVVVRERDKGRVPVGIVTDRDIVVGVLTTGLDYKTVSVGEIMGRDLVSARENDEVLAAFKAMRRRGIRRLPVVSESGELAGIVTVDDLLGIVAEQFGDLVKVISAERSREARARV